MPTLADLRGETRELVVALDEPLSLCYYPEAFTPQVFDFITLLDDPTQEDHTKKREAIIGILLQLLASWELYTSKAEEDAKENALPVSEAILYRMTFKNMRTILDAIFEDLNPSPTSAVSTNDGALTAPSTEPRRKKAA